jgi:actin-related protein
MVVDCGYGVTSAMFVYDGFIYPTTLQQLDIGGNDVSRYLRELLSDQGILDNSLQSQSIANDIKEKHARLARDFAQESFAARANPETYVLPDGREIILKGEQLRCAEVLFQPALMGKRGVGIHDMALNLMAYCDKNDREDGPMRALTNFLVVCGGGSFIPGMEDRIVKEIAAKHKSREFYASVFNAPERQHAAWIGGSILSSLPSFIDNNFVCQAEYMEEGAKIINQKCC